MSCPAWQTFSTYLHTCFPVLPVDSSMIRNILTVYEREILRNGKLFTQSPLICFWGLLLKAAFLVFHAAMIDHGR